MTVDPQSAAYDPRPLIPYLAELGLPYLYESQNIMEQVRSDFLRGSNLRGRNESHTV